MKKGISVLVTKTTGMTGNTSSLKSAAQKNKHVTEGSTVANKANTKNINTIAIASLQNQQRQHSNGDQVEPDQ